MKLWALPLLVFLTSVKAEVPCMPLVPTPQWEAEEFSLGITKNGGWVEWACVNTATGAKTFHIRVGTVDEIARAGAKLRTILLSPDPLKSLQTLPNRSTVLPLSDPSLSAIVDDWLNSRGKL